MDVLRSDHALQSTNRLWIARASCHEESVHYIVFVRPEEVRVDGLHLGEQLGEIPLEEIRSVVDGYISYKVPTGSLCIDIGFLQPTRGLQPFKALFPHCALEFPSRNPEFVRNLRERYCIGHLRRTSASYDAWYVLDQTHGQIVMKPHDSRHFLTSHTANAGTTCDLP